MSENNEILNEEEFDEEEQDNLVYLSDESGSETAFEFLDLINYQGNDYVVLSPADEGDDGEVYILMLEESEGEDQSIVSVDDEAVLQAVFDIFKERFSEEYEFSE